MELYAMKAQYDLIYHQYCRGQASYDQLVKASDRYLAFLNR